MNWRTRLSLFKAAFRARTIGRLQCWIHGKHTPMRSAGFLQYWPGGQTERFESVTCIYCSRKLQ